MLEVVRVGFPRFGVLLGTLLGRGVAVESVAVGVDELHGILELWEGKGRKLEMRVPVQAKSGRERRITPGFLSGRHSRGPGPE